MKTAYFAAAGAVIFTLVRCGLVSGEDPVSHTEPASDFAIYSKDPNHLWNRLHRTLFVRTSSAGVQFGQDVVDPLLWPTTTHLLTEDSHKKAIDVLDEFLREDGQAQVASPVARALLQHDLWSVFDWTIARRSSESSDADSRRALQGRLAKAIERLAMSAGEIAALSDNYALAVSSQAYPTTFDPDRPDTPFLPLDLSRTDGSWVCLTNADTVTSLAELHQRANSGRSTFLVLISLPGGRQATLDFVGKLADSNERWQRMRFGPGESNAVDSLPPFPVGTQFALARRMNLISSAGEVMMSPITQSVQIWIHRTLHGDVQSNEERDTTQSFFQFDLRKKLLLAGRQGGLKATGMEDWAFQIFMAHAFDPLESDNPLPHFGQHRVRQHCIDCHRTTGGALFLSYARPFTTPRGAKVPALQPGTPLREAEHAAKWKGKQRDWRQLQELFEAERAVSQRGR